MVQFVLFGMVMSSWLSRLPSVRDALGVNVAQLGSLLVVGGVGALIGSLTVGAVVARFGGRTTLLVGVGGTAIGFGLLALSLVSGDVRLFVAGALINGLCGALINVPINANAAEVERRVGRTILPHFHAGFSIGAATGALIAAGFSTAGIDAELQIVIVLTVATIARLLLLAPATALTITAPLTTATGSLDAHATTTRNRHAVRSALSAWLEPRTLLLGVVLLAASLAEGTATTWLPIAVVDGFVTPEATGALAYATFVGAMTVFRVLGTPIVDRLGRVTVLRTAGLASIVGVLLFVFAPSLVLAWLGILLWGCGAALGVPIAISAASDDPARASARVAVVTSFSTVSSLAAPPLLGLLAEGVGARTAMLVVAVVAVVSFAVAGTVRARPPTIEHDEPTSDGPASDLAVSLAATSVRVPRRESDDRRDREPAHRTAPATRENQQPRSHAPDQRCAPPE